LCPVQVAARVALQAKLDSRPYLYSVTVDPDRRPSVTPAQKCGPGCPRKGTATNIVDTNADCTDPIDVDTAMEHKCKRQSTLLFCTTGEGTSPGPPLL
jgi:hypothetical protein